MCSKFEDQLIMLKKFPLILPQNSHCTVYAGFLVIEKQFFHLSILVPKYPSLANLQVRSCWEFSFFLQGKEEELKVLADSCSMLNMYLTKLQNLVSSCMKMRGLPSNQLDCTGMEGFRRLMSDLEVVGTKHIEFLSSSMSLLKLRVMDDAQRCHVLRLDVGVNYPHQNIQVQADLPSAVIQIIKQNSSIVGMFRTFTQHVAALQGIWAQLDSVDDECWVLNPEKPTRRDMTRRIVLGPSLFLHLEFDPIDSAGRPGITFLGPQREVQHFLECLEANSEEWQDTNNLVENLKCVLGVATFPIRPENEAKNQLVCEGECAICFSMELESELPSEICKNSSCANCFHASCLLEWLQCVPGNLQSFNRIHGTCPSCGTAISCPISR